MPIEYKDIKGFSLKTTFGVKNECKISDSNEFVCIAPKQYAYKNDTKIH